MAQVRKRHSEIAGQSFSVLRTLPNTDGLIPSGRELKVLIMKWTAAVFILVLILIVFAANLGFGPSFFSFVYLISGGDKVGHFFLMGFLSLLVNMALCSSRVRIFSLEFPKGSLIVLTAVTLEEFSQLFLRFRGFSIADLLFDYIGIILFGILATHI
ncbi:MAG: VanZ family protein [Anaerolineales bacterium]|nr:VanZ family protein [Anaerolineales bacterium]